jgi:hypothetical protein
MTAPKSKKIGDATIVSEIFFDKDGNQVDDPKTAASGEVTLRHPDGSLEHVQLVNTPDKK